VVAINFGLDLDALLLTSDLVGVVIPKDQVTRLVAERGWFFHRLLLTMAGGGTHQIRCGFFPRPRLFEAVRKGLLPAVPSGLTWQGYAPRVCRGEIAGIKAPYFLLRCQSLPRAEALVKGRTPAARERLRGESRVISFSDGSAAAYFPLRSAGDARPCLEELFRGDSGQPAVLSGGLCGGLSEEDNRAILSTVGLSQACMHGQTLILG
jgi:hypothetical protein